MKPDFFFLCYCVINILLINKKAKYSIYPCVKDSVATIVSIIYSECYPKQGQSTLKGNGVVECMSMYPSNDKTLTCRKMEKLLLYKAMKHHHMYFRPHIRIYHHYLYPIPTNTMKKGIVHCQK